MAAARASQSGPTVSPSPRALTCSTRWPQYDDSHPPCPRLASCEAPRSTGPPHWDSTISARSRPESGRRCSPSDFRRGSMMWKNIWCAECPRQTSAGCKNLEPWNPENLTRLLTYASFVRFSHSVFALPFALTGALLALNKTGEWNPSAVAWRLLWIVVAMVAARSAAMGFNRLVDASYDALNPRTASREIPRGVMSRGEAAIFITVSSVVFVYAAWKLGTICCVLSPVALAIVFWYSLAKR